MDEKLQHILDGLPFKLNDKQLAAIEAYINGDGHFLLMSEAGGGKSLIIDILKQYYGDEMITCASTGVGNQNLHKGKGGDGTAHRCLSIPYYVGDRVEKVKSPCSNIFSSSDLVKHIVLDEVSMLNSEFLQVLKLRLNRFNKRTKNRHARNIRVLFVGDVLQLSPVISKGDEQYLTERYGSPYFYRSWLWQEFNPTVIMLDEVMRQSDKVFKAFLDVLRYGQEERYEGALKWINQRVHRDYDKSMFTVAAYKATVDNVNKRVLAANKNDKYVYTAEITGEFNLIENDIEKDKVLCAGLECITTINDEMEEFFNGTLVTIDQCTSEGCWCIVNNTGKRIFVPIHEYKQEETYVEKGVITDTGEVKDVLRKKETGTCKQLPMTQSSAISVHRAQGKTFINQGVVDLGVKGFYEREGDFGAALCYVALSRFESVDQIILPRPLHKNHIKTNQDAIDFWFECKERSVI